MQFILCLACVLAFGANANTVDVTPVQKVVTLLEGMLEKGKAEKHAEQAAFAKSKQFCDDTSAVKNNDITEEIQNINTLGATIQKAGSDANRMGKEISALQADESTWAGDMKAASGVRTVEKADYEATHKEYSEAIEAIGRAVTVLKAQTHDRVQAAGQAGSLVQVTLLQKLSLIPADAKRAIDIFLVQRGEEAANDMREVPEANAYEFQSNGIIDMLEKLQSKFIDEKATLEKEEVNDRQAFELLRQSLTQQIGQAEKDESETGVQKGKKLSVKAMKLNDQGEVVVLENGDERYLKELTADCSMTAADFESRQQLRTDEIQTIEKTIGIITSDAVAGHAATHLPAFLQKKAASLAQVHSFLNPLAALQLLSENAGTVQGRTAALLHIRAKSFNSLVLEAMAKRAAVDPFSKVKKMLKDLVVRLMEEANEETEHKGWCDTELATNKQTRAEKTDVVQTLTADIDALKASVAKISGEVSDLSDAVSELSQAMSTSTQLRGEEKAAATTTVSDAQDAQTALAQALTVLKDFYAKAAEATSFAQTLAPYNGMAAENGGVIGMLEVIESDFARLESETKASEATAQKGYDEFMSDSKADKASKDTAIEHKKAKSQDATQTLTEKETDLAGTQKELDAALSYFEKLRPSCVDSGATYEDRTARRKEEIQALQEGLKIMNGEDIM